MKYTDINAQAVDQWVADGWEWGTPIDHETYVRAQQGDWQVLLTPTKPVPRSWFGELRGARVLGLASGGGQLQAGFRLTDLYEDTNGQGNLHRHNIPSFIATRCVK